MTNPRFGRRTAVLALLLGVLTVASALALRHAGEWLRASAEAALQARLVPRVTIAERVEWSLLPVPAVTLRRLSLHEGADEPVLEVPRLTLRLSPRALWRGELAVAEITVTGAALTLRRDAAGWNVAHWQRPSPSGADGATPPPIGRIEVEDARVRLVGEPAEELVVLHMTAGPFAPDATGTLELSAQANGADAALDVSARADYRLDAEGATLGTTLLQASGRLGVWRLERGALRLGGLRWTAAAGLDAGATTLTLAAVDAHSRLDLEAALGGLAADGTGWRARDLALTLTAAHDGQQLAARVAAPAASGGTEQWRMPQLTLTLASEAPAPVLRLELAGGLTGTVAPDAPALHLDVERGSAQLPHPAGTATPLALSFSGTAQFEPMRRVASGTLAGAVDDSRFEGAWRFDAGATPPLTLDASLDRIVLDRYLPPASAEPDPADLAAWRNWPVAATLRIGRLQLGELRSDDARLQLRGGGAVTDAR